MPLDTIQVNTVINIVLYVEHEAKKAAEDHCFSHDLEERVANCIVKLELLRAHTLCTHVHAAAF